MFKFYKQSAAHIWLMFIYLFTLESEMLIKISSQQRSSFCHKHVDSKKHPKYAVRSRASQLLPAC